MPIKPMYFTVAMLLITSGCSISTQAPDQQALHPDIRKAMSGGMKDDYAPPVFCGKWVRIQLDPARIADGSPTYFDNSTGKVIAQCDNPMVRMQENQRAKCPPAQWTCH